MKYLIMDYTDEENGFPMLVTDDPSNYGYCYAIYKILDNGKLILTKDYDKPCKEGFALYSWNADADAEKEKPIVILTFENKKRKDLTPEFIRKIIETAGFTEEFDEIEWALHCSGQYGEEIDGKWVVFGEYLDNKFSLGY